jgi:peptide-methionine (S)-S-oxide reductase
LRRRSGPRKPDAEERTDLPAPAVGVTPPPGRAVAVFAGGCFWSVELAYQREPGVTRTAVGYCQGQTPNPTYEQVCSGRTGHTEAVLVEYDPSAVSFERLCDVLWSKIDATQANGQGGDIGTQYRTGIYYTTEADRAVAIASRAKEQARLGRTVATEIFPAMQWYDAEKYHQSYLAKVRAWTRIARAMHA